MKAARTVGAAVFAPFLAAGTASAHAALPSGGYHPDESEYGVTASGTTINGTYTAPNNQPFFVGGYQFGPDLAGNVAGITCSVHSYALLELRQPNVRARIAGRSEE